MTASERIREARTAVNVTVYDNGGKTFDRYTVILREFDYALGIGHSGNVPNGFCMSLSPEEYVEGPHMGKVIPFEEMSEPAQRAVTSELNWARRESQNCSTPRKG